MTEFVKITTPLFRLSFPEIWKAKAFDENQDPRFSIMMCFPKDTDLSEMKAELKRVANEKFGKKKPKGFKQPIKDGEDLDIEGMEDYFTVRAISTRKPGIVDKDLNLITEEESELIYAGCWCRATINAYAYEYKKISKGVSFGLSNIQVIKDGEPFVASTKPQEDFEEYEGDPEEESSDEDWD